MKKPRNYRWQMYRTWLKPVCTNCWFWCIFCRIALFFAHFQDFYAETSYLCSFKFVNKELRYILTSLSILN